MFVRKRRSQAAIEFLTTYGWAFLLIIVLIGGLQYFGVLDPDNLRPTVCKSSEGFFCQEVVASSTTNTLLLVIKSNLFPFTLSEDDLVVTIETPDSNCDNPRVGIGLAEPDGSKTFSVNELAYIQVSNCTLPLKSRVVGTISGPYATVNAELDKKISISFDVPINALNLEPIQTELSLPSYMSEPGDGVSGDGGSDGAVIDMPPADGDQHGECLNEGTWGTLDNFLLSTNNQNLLCALGTADYSAPVNGLNEWTCTGWETSVSCFAIILEADQYGECGYEGEYASLDDFLSYTNVFDPSYLCVAGEFTLDTSGSPLVGLNEWQCVGTETTSYCSAVVNSALTYGECGISAGSIIYDTADLYNNPSYPSNMCIEGEISNDRFYDSRGYLEWAWECVGTEYTAVCYGRLW